MESLKFDLFLDVVYVFILKGDVYELLNGFVLFDFVYCVYIEIGNKIIGVKINGKIVIFDYKLKMGDIIDILMFKYFYGLSCDWFKLV